MRGESWGWAACFLFIVLLAAACRDSQPDAPPASATPNVVQLTPQAPASATVIRPAETGQAPTQTPPAKPIKPAGEAATMTTTAAAQQPDDARPNEWTVLLYMSATEGLDAAAVAALNAIESIPNAPFHVVAQLDRQRVVPQEDDWSGTRRYVRQSGEDGLQLAEEMGTVNMGDPDSLSDFIVWALDAYPASRTALILWGNHDGWRGLSADADDDDDLSLSDLAGALERSRARATGSQFDLIVLEGGRTATLEVLAALQPYARYAAASVGLPFAPPRDYAGLLDELAAADDLTPELFARLVSAPPSAAPSVVQPAMTPFDLSSLPLVTEAMQALSEAIGQYAQLVVPSLAQAHAAARLHELQGAPYLEPDEAIELRRFARRLEQLAPLPDLRRRAAAMVAALDAVAVRGDDSAPAPADAEMVVAFLPAELVDDPGYGELDGAGWQGALRAFYTAQVEHYSLAQGQVWTQSAGFAGIQQPALVGIQIRSTATESAAMSVFQQNSEGQVRLLDVQPLAPAVEDAAESEGWPAGVTQMELAWDATSPYVSDGTNGDFAPLWPVAAGAPFYAIKGLYSASGEESSAVEAALLFDEPSHSIAGFWLAGHDREAAAWRAPEPGDSFQLYNILQEADGALAYAPGATLVYTGGAPIEFEYAPLPDGDYRLSVLTQEISGMSLLEAAPLAVNNQQRLAGYHVYQNREHGFQFLYPASWPTPVFDGRRLTTAAREQGPALSVTSHAQVGQGLAAAGRLKLETLAAFGDPDILYEEVITVAGSDGTLTAYGYDAGDGPHTGVFITFVDDSQERGYVIDVDGLALDEAETLEAARHVAATWQFVPIREGQWPEQWRRTEVGPLSVWLPGSYEHSVLENGWALFQDGDAFLAVRQEAISGRPPAEVGNYWADVAARGVDDFEADELQPYALRDALWSRVAFQYDSARGLVAGLILATVYDGQEVVAWIEAPADSLDGLLADFYLPALAGMLPAAPGSAGILFEDSFEDEGGWGAGRQEGAVGALNDGVYRLEVDASRGFFWTSAGRQFGAAEYEVHAAQVAGSGNAASGLLIGVDHDAQSFYLFEISSDGYVWIGRCAQSCSEATTLAGDGWFASEAIQRGLESWNRLRVVAGERTLAFFVNDRLVAEIEPGQRISGDVGLAVETFEEGGATVQFDNLRVSSP